MNVPAIRSTPFALAAIGLAVYLATPSAPERHQSTSATPDIVGDQSQTLLIDVADSLDADERAAFLATLPGEPRLNSVYSEHEGLYRLDLDAATARELLATLRDDRRVEFIEPERAIVLDTAHVPFTSACPAGAPPDDPLYPFQWHFDQIDVEGAWSQEDGAGTVVAVIDTGVAYTDGAPLRQVRDLSGTAFVPGYDFVDDDDLPLDEHGHGTHVAGTIAQTTNNGYGVAGIAPQARIMPIRVLDATGRGNTADIAESIRWAADNGADIINMSLGGPLPSGIMQDAVTYAHRKGVTVIAAAGNNGWSLPSYPAAYRNVIAVSATQFDRTTTFYSNYGRYIDIAAPGGNVRVDQNDDGRPDGVMQETLQRGNPSGHEFALYMGTSMAAPHVAGVAALVHASGVTNPDRIEDVLASTASTDVPAFETDRYGAGLLDASASVRAGATRIAAPRGFGAAALALLLLAAAPRRTRAVAIVTGAVVASGVALLTLPLTAIGLATPTWLATSPVMALGNGLPALAQLLAWSAVPAVGAYAVLGGVERPALRGVLVGALLGFGAILGFEALAITVDVSALPGTGCLDRLWLGTNAALTLAIGAAAARPR